MEVIAAVRVAEGWSVGNYLGVVVLVGLVAVVAWGIVRSVR